MTAELGGSPTAAQQALVLAATASYAALYIVREKLHAARRFRRVETLIGQLTPLQGALLRTLAALGLTAGAADDQRAPTLEDAITDFEREKQNGEKPQ